MGRYVRVLLSLAVLAAIYYRLGGFEPETTPPPQLDLDPMGVVEPAPAPLATATHEDPAEIQLAQAAALPDPILSAAVRAPVTETVTIGRNESFYVALQRAGLSHEIIMGIVNTAKPHTNLRKVKRGDTFLIARHADESFASIRFDLDAEHYLDVVSNGDGLEAEISSYPLERVVKGVRGRIETNLFDALVEQNADPILAGQMADILGWDVDFFRDLRVGDTFAVLYEEFLHEGRKVRDGHVLAAHFVNRGKAHEAYLFENRFDLPSYFDEEGNSLEKQFLRAPLKYSRISSGFSKRRLHPVLKRYRPHYGVDYAAPVGTPVLATADGVVTHRERKKGNGNYVGLRHGQGYESFYLHLSKFPREMRVGDKVKQGDVIGFVGQTGWATGPHLDYRVKKNGKWVDARKLKLPPAEPVPAEQRPEFESLRDELLAQLQMVPEDLSGIVVLEVAEPILTDD